MIERLGSIARQVAIGSLLLTPILIAPAPAQTQTLQDTQRLEALSQELATRWERRRSPLYHKLLRSANPTQQRLNDDPGIQLMGIDGYGHPIYYITNNIFAAATIRTSEVWPFGGGGYNLTGSNTRPGELGIWDGGLVLPNHQELLGRVHHGEVSSFFPGHSTHVAGTMIASGFDPFAKGMSYEAHLLSFNHTDDTQEVAQQAAAGLQISNHSYNRATGWRGRQWFGDFSLGGHEDWRFGFYDSLAMEWDQVAYNAPYYLHVRSAGNDRNDDDLGTGSHDHYDFENEQWVDATDYHPPDGDPFGFDTIPADGCAKNILTVGAVLDLPGAYTQPDDVVATVFTSWGPTDDGRIKPDIVANGDSVYSCSNSWPDYEVGYEIMSGTSMAAPSVSGSVNLLRELYESTYLALPRSSTLKAVVLHAADEAGWANGPDYSFGWGLFNTHAAADVISATPLAGSGISEEFLVDGNTDYFYFHVAAPRDLRVTIAWTDPPGVPSEPVIDAAAKMLVNDLDLRLEHLGSSTVHEPWHLDKTNPLGAATQRDNDVDNVERVDAYDAPAGDYRVAVSHKGTVTTGEQSYSLVWSGLVTAPPIVAVEPGGGTAQLSLQTPYPNPASGVTVVQFATASSGPVRIEVFDARGRVMKTLLNGVLTAGPRSVRFDTTDFRSGMYFVRLTAGSQQIEKRFAVVR